MKAKKEKSGNVRISPEVLKEVKRACIDKEVSVRDFIDEAAREKLKREKRKSNEGI